MTKKKGVHHWDPIWMTRDANDPTRYLHGICMECKRVKTAEELMRRLNKYERVCAEFGIEVEFEEREDDD